MSVNKDSINNRFYAGSSCLAGCSTILSALLFVACGLLDLKVRTVYFDTNGAEDIPQQNVTYGHKVDIPEPMPTRTGYSLDGWSADPELNTVYDFNLPVKDNMTLYAKWVSSHTVRLTELHASLMGETMIGAIDEGSIPPTVTLTLQQGYRFGTDLNATTLTKVGVAPKGARTNKQAGDVANLNLKEGRTLTVTSFDRKVSRSYELLLRYTSPSATVITYNGTDTLGQAIQDTVLLPDDIVLSAYHLAPLTAFGVVFDNVIGNAQSDEYGTVLFKRTQLESTAAKPGQALQLTYRGDTLDLAPYQPYDIWDWRDLQAMRQDLGGSYRLMKDITLPDLGEQGLSVKGFEPVGFDSDDSFNKLKKPFTGNFDGRHHTIANFSIARSDRFDVGLFGLVIGKGRNNPTSLKDVYIRHSGVAGKRAVGTLVGIIGNAVVSGIGVTALNTHHEVFQTSGTQDINWNIFLGAVVGVSEESSITAYAESNVKSHRGAENSEVFIGGLVGRIKDGQVTGYATGNVTGEHEVNAPHNGGNPSSLVSIGGLVGSAQNSQIVGYATGNVTGRDAISDKIRVGGFLGETFPRTGTVIGYATGKVVMEIATIIDAHVGGMAGYAYINSTSKGYARGNIERQGQGAVTTFGKLFGGHDTNNVISVSGYHSGKAGESEILPASFTDATGVDGTAIIISVATTQQDFSAFTFGNATGEWTFTSGRWPAINLPPEVGGKYLPQDQPTSP